MLTGDKLETATCIAKSSHLVSRTQDIHIFRPVSICLKALRVLNVLSHNQNLLVLLDCMCNYLVITKEGEYCNFLTEFIKTLQIGFYLPTLHGIKKLHFDGVKQGLNSEVFFCRTVGFIY